MNTNDQTVSGKSRKGLAALGVVAAIVALAGAVAIGVGSASAEQIGVRPAMTGSAVTSSVPLHPDMER